MRQPDRDPLTLAVADLIEQAVRAMVLAMPAPVCACQPQQDEGERLLTLEQVAERMACGVTYVRDELIGRGLLRPVPGLPGRMLRFRLADVNDLIRRLAGVRVPPAAQVPQSNVRQLRRGRGASRPKRQTG